MNLSISETSSKKLFILYSVTILFIFSQSLKELFILSFQREVYSHIALIPLISGYFIYSNRKIVFSSSSHSINNGILVTLLGIVMYLVAKNFGDYLNRNDYLSIMTFAAILSWVGGYSFFYGMDPLRSAKFPFLFLAFMIPIPTWLIDRVILFLQEWSAEATNGLFLLAGIPFLREGETFHLSELSIQVAEQCSGIRSSIALFITSILAGHLFLESAGRKVVLSLSVIPITVFKNALRITTLTLLGNYVDKQFITDSLLHRRGGVLFFTLALLSMVPLLWLLRRSGKERRPNCR